jgi:hypothetical protein
MPDAVERAYQRGSQFAKPCRTDGGVGRELRDGADRCGARADLPRRAMRCDEMRLAGTLWY